MNRFRYHEPSTLAEACRLLAEHGPAARALAGGTDLLLQMESGRLRPETVVYLGRIPALREIAWEPRSGLRIGAGATLRQVETHPVVRERYPALAESARVVGSVQIRNLATLAGNLCNASPSADTSPALLALDAEVEVVGPDGEATVPVSDFWTGPGRTILRPGQLVAALRLPPPAPEQRSWYYKLAVRQAMDLAMVGICVALEPGEAAPRNVRLALGAVAPVCLRAREAERLAESGPPTPERLEAVAAAAVAATSPIDDQRASAEYRREMVRALTRRAVQRLLTDLTLTGRSDAGLPG